MWRVANRLAIEAPAELGGAFNIASGRPRSIGDLATGLADAIGGPRPEITGEFRLGDVRHVFASTERARAALGFEARVDLGAGLREFAAARLRDPAPPQPA